MKALERLFQLKANNAGTENFKEGEISSNKGAELGQAQPGLVLDLNKFDLNNGNGGFGKGLNVSFGPTDKV